MFWGPNTSSPRVWKPRVCWNALKQSVGLTKFKRNRRFVDFLSRVLVDFENPGKDDGN